MKKKAMQLNNLYLQIRTDKFYYLKFILEGYDGLALLSSSGIRKDIVLIRYPEEQKINLFALLASIADSLNPYR